MAQMRQTWIGGKDVNEVGLVRITWNGALPIPSEDAEPRQILDFTAIVALSESPNTADKPEILRRAVAAYEKQYNVRRVLTPE